MMQLRGWEEQPELSAFRLGDFRSNTLRSQSGVNDPLSSTSSTDLDREQVSSTQCGGRRRMHAAQHKKQQRIGKRTAASLSAASNQKPKKQTPPQEQHCSFWTFHFLLLFLLTPRTKTPQKQTTRSQHETTSATTAKKERGEKKTVIKFCLEKSLCFSHRQRQQSQSRTEKRTQWGRGREWMHYDFLLQLRWH